MIRTHSVSPALRLLSAACMTVILVATGIILSSIHHGAMERSFDRRLDVVWHALVADVAAPKRSRDRGTPTLGESLFDLPLSGWYWQITALDTSKPEIRSSRSLWDTGLARLRDEDATMTPDGARRGYAIGLEEQRLRLLEHTVDLGEQGRYLIAVAGDPQEIDDETRAFDRVLLITFGILAAVLLVITMFQERFGLAPLRRVSEALAAIEARTAERLDSRFPGLAGGGGRGQRAD